MRTVSIVPRTLWAVIALLVIHVESNSSSPVFTNSTVWSITSNTTAVRNATALHNSTSAFATSSSFDSTISSSALLGDYIAAGLGQSTLSTSSLSNDLKSTSPNQSSFSSTKQDNTTTHDITSDAPGSSSSSAVALGDYIAAGLDYPSSTQSSPTLLRHGNISVPGNSTLYGSASSSVLPQITIVHITTNTTRASSSGNLTSSVSSNLTASMHTHANNVTSLASTGNGSLYASACNSAWYNYSISSGFASISTTTVTFTTTNYTASIYTLCDGRPRITGTLTPTASGVTSAWSLIDTISSTVATPTCSINPNDCAALLSSYSMESSEADASFSLLPYTTLFLASNLQTFAINNSTTTFGTDEVPPTLTVSPSTYTAISRSISSKFVSVDYNIDGYGDFLEPGYAITGLGDYTISRPLTVMCSNEPVATQSEIANCSGQFSSYSSYVSEYGSAASVFTATQAQPTTTISLASDKNTFVSGTDTTVFGSSVWPTTSGPNLTVDGITYRPYSRSKNPVFYDIDGYSGLTPGGEVVGGVYQEFTALSYPQLPTCGLDPSCKSSPCTIYGGQVKLLYFPVPTNGTRDMCASTPLGSATPCPAGPLSIPWAEESTMEEYYHVTECPYAQLNMTTANSGPYIVVNATTFYRNRAYISLETVWASNTCGRVGSNYPGALLTIASSDLYSVRGYHYELAFSAWSFNWNDLNTPVPWSAYDGMPDLDIGHVINGCGDLNADDMVNGQYGGEFCVSTIWDDAYRPVLAAPLQIRDLDPKWATCVLALDGLYDPPQVLTTASELLPASTTAATPASSASHNQPSETGVASSQTTKATGAQSGIVDPQTSPIDTPSDPASSNPTGSSSANSDVAPTSSIQTAQPTDPKGGSSIEATTQSTDEISSLPAIPASSAPAGTQTPDPKGPDDPSPTSDDPTGDDEGSTSANLGSGVNDPQSTTPPDPLGSVVSIFNHATTSDPAHSVSADPAAAIVSIIDNGGHSTTESAQDPSDPTATAGGNTGADPTNAPVATDGTTSAAQAIASIGTVPVSINSDGNAVLGSKTLTAGETTVISDQAVSIGTSAIVIANTEDPEIAITTITPQSAGNDPAAASDPDSTPADPLLITAGGHTYTASPVAGGQGTNAVVINGAILTVSGDAVTTAGQVFSAYSGGIVIGSESITLGSSFFAPASGGIPSADAASGFTTVIAVGNQPVTASYDVSGPSSIIHIGSQAITVGGSAVTINKVFVSAGTQGLVVGSSTLPMPIAAITSDPQDPADTLTVISIAGRPVTFSQSSGVFVVGTQTLSIGGAAATINGVSISAGTAGLIIGGSNTLAMTAATPNAVVTLPNEVLTASRGPSATSILYLGSEKLTVGGAAKTVDGVLVSAASDGLVVGGSTIVPLTAVPSSVDGHGEAVVTIAGQTFTASRDDIAASVVDVGSRKLTVGGAATTIEGVVFSAGSAGLIVGSSTISFPSSSHSVSGTRKTKGSFSLVTTSAPALESATSVGSGAGHASTSTSQRSAAVGFSSRAWALVLAMVCFVVAW